MGATVEASTPPCDDDGCKINECHCDDDDFLGHTLPKTGKTIEMPVWVWYNLQSYPSRSSVAAIGLPRFAEIFRERRTAYGMDEELFYALVAGICPDPFSDNV